MASPITTDIAIIGATNASFAAFHEDIRAGKSALLIGYGTSNRQLAPK